AADACRRAVLVELVHIDLEYRVRAGEALRAADYVDRYPELGEEEGILRSLQSTEEELRGQSQSRPQSGASGQADGSEQGTARAGESATGSGPEPSSLPPRLGRFELLEPIGS